MRRVYCLATLFQHVAQIRQATAELDVELRQSLLHRLLALVQTLSGSLLVVKQAAQSKERPFLILPRQRFHSADGFVEPLAEVRHERLLSTLPSPHVLTW